MKKKKSPKSSLSTQIEAERKQNESEAAQRLSSNPNEPVEKGIVKVSRDEAQSRPD